MAASLGSEAVRKWNALGIHSIETEPALEALGGLLDGSSAQVSVLPADWMKFFQLFPQGLEPAMLQDLVPAKRRLAPPSREWRKLVREVRQAPKSEREDLLATYVEKLVGKTLGLDGSEAIDRQRGFFDLGMDSLMAVELRNRLQAELGLSHVLPITFVFDHPTIDALVEYLRAEVIAEAEDAETPDDTQAPRRAAADEPVAIIGFACRFPGGVRDGESFWRLLADGALRKVAWASRHNRSGESLLAVAHSLRQHGHRIQEPIGRR